MKHIDLTILDYNRIVDSFHSESDRAAAVLAGSFLEHFLSKFLRSLIIKEMPEKEINELFESAGPFSDFKQRYEVAYAFGLIPSDVRNDIKYIAKIRNHFAHHPLDAKFDSQPVSDFCAQLMPYQQMLEAHGNQGKRVVNRLTYLVTVGTCVAGMQLKMHKNTENNA